MKKLGLVFGLAAMSLAGCETYEGGAAAPGGEFIATLPQGVLDIVSPAQDLTAVRIDPTTGCYIYRYQGPVETTYLPLRTQNGNPICTRRQI